MGLTTFKLVDDINGYKKTIFLIFRNFILKVINILTKHYIRVHSMQSNDMNRDSNLNKIFQLVLSFTDRRKEYIFMILYKQQFNISNIYN